jgi:uncharacterized protein (TIGR01777 family)
VKVLITGSTGLVGSALAMSLTEGGHTVRRLVRKAAGLAPEEFSWNPSAAKLDSGALKAIDAVVHLAGENIAAGRWTRARKQLIRESRITGTKLLAEAMARMPDPPPVLISASGINYYGSRGEELISEDTPPGEGFLASLCQEWEAATGPAAERGVRVVLLRTGIVLSAKGGALPKMLLPFKLGLGGRIGSGRQYMSWITIDDLVGVIKFAAENSSIQGPVNAVAPGAVTNSEFTRTLARVVSRPVVLPLPAFAVRLAMGEMSDELLLFSARVEPARLLATGYQFRHRRLEEALREILSA